ncbi:MAG: hypothetical protein WD069_09265 [Planctomycetales bacterium]
MTSLVPLLAQIEGCSAVAVAFVVITIIGWILQLVSGAKRQEQQRARRPVQPRPRDDRLQSEIDLFLEEVGGRRRPPEPARRREPAGPAILEVVPEERPRAEGRLPSARSRPAQPQPPQRTAAQRARIESRHIDSSRLGGEVRAHLQESLEVSRVSAHVSQHLAPIVEKSDSEHLGMFTGGGGALGTAATTRSSGLTHPVVALVRNPQGMRQAILLSEILGRPLAQRRASS